ncbi:MAG: hypothetical protein BroJett014_27690 [Planctomycetota bacterium]|nr:MAG: hypothetical protein BroJett014_27690 [Planctomycetota bacterium]
MPMTGCARALWLTFAAFITCSGCVSQHSWEEIRSKEGSPGAEASIPTLVLDAAAVEGIDYRRLVAEACQGDVGAIRSLMQFHTADAAASDCHSYILGSVTLAAGDLVVNCALAQCGETDASRTITALLNEFGSDDRETGVLYFRTYLPRTYSSAISRGLLG